MIKTETLFILGAGASVDYKLPTGAGLTKEIISFLDDHQETFRDEFLGIKRDINGFARVAKIIRNSRSPTIDSFIRDNAKYSKSLKAAIAGVLLRHQDRVLADDGFPERDWLAWMFHTKLATHPDVFESNRIAFLSFNYERIPEGLLARFMANTHECDVLDALEVVRSGYSVLQGDMMSSGERFVHVHGRLESDFEHYGREAHRKGSGDKLMLQTIRPGNLDEVAFYEQISGGMVTISESDASAKRDFVLKQQYANMFEGVKRVYILGIGYHEENLLRIGLDKDMCAELSGKLEFFGGTGHSVRGRNREDVKKRMGSGFQLGEPDQDCLSFLQEYLD